MIIQSHRLKTSPFNLNNALILGFLFLGAVFASAQNLVTNPGFETGDTTGWFAFGSPTISAETSQVHSGTYAAQVSNRTQTYMGIAQSFVGSPPVGPDIQCFGVGQAGWRREPDHAVDDAKNGWKRYFLCGDRFGFRVFEWLDAAFRAIHVQSFGHSHRADFVCGNAQQLDQLILY